ncbi:hypothetical protein PRZ48_004154 [Zasmidium cellare]|uniref:Uncharacterized protein n=1 Tax=Zasmidium cellare TaxID=395010 RepID=A0ABR0EXU0_ZASCE|nr:hypothetical protein PRZ48_004154 [Zasmidium cellare]
MSDLKAAEAIASQGGGAAPAPAAAERSAPVEANKMENKLEVNKENKPKTEKATDVAGRKEKGTPGGFFKKLMPWKKEKKTETTAAATT